MEQVYNEIPVTKIDIVKVYLMTWRNAFYLSDKNIYLVNVSQYMCVFW